MLSELCLSVLCVLLLACLLLSSSTDHFLHSQSTWEKMATDHIYTVQIRSQTGLESLDSKAQIRTLIVQAWVTCPLFGQLIIARKRSHCRNIVVLSNHVNKRISSGKVEDSCPQRGFRGR